MTTRRTGNLFAMLGLAAAYFVGAKLGFLVAPAHQVVSSAWPPAGLALAALVLFGPRLWPGIAVGALIANYTSGIALPAAAAIAAGNTLEAIAGAWLLKQLSFRPALDRLQDVLALMAVAIMATGLSASIGVATLWQSGAATGHLGTLWLAWWSGDAIGILIVGALALVWLTPPARAASLPSATEAVLLILALGALTAFVISRPVPYVYPVFPVAMLTAYRLGPRGAAVANLIVAGVAAYFTVTGVGAFALPSRSPTDNVFLFQAFIALLAVTTLMSAAVLAEQRRAEADLRSSEARLSEAQAVAQLGSWSWESDTNRVVWSDELYRIYGVDPATFRATLEGFLGRVHPDDRERVAAAVRRAVEERGTFQLDERIVRPDGDIRVLESRGKVVSGEGRGPVLVGICQDVTERRRAQQSLAASEAKFATLFHASPVAICLIALEKAEVIDANRRFYEMFGTPAREGLIGASTRSLGMWNEPGELRDLLARLRRQGSIRETPVKYDTAEGQQRRAVAALELIEIGGVECAVVLYWRP